MYRYYMRKSDPEEPPKLEEPLDERDGRVKRLRDKQEQDQDEKLLEEKFYRWVLCITFRFGLIWWLAIEFAVGSYLCHVTYLVTQW